MNKTKDCRNCIYWFTCPCGKNGHDKGTSIGYSIGECKRYKENFMEWIDISEKLPPIEEDILVCDIDGDIYLTHRVANDDNAFRCYDSNGNKIKSIVAWMPLPKPYQK